MEKEESKKTSMSYNQNFNTYSEDDRLGGWPSDVETQRPGEQRNHYSSTSKPPSNPHSKMAQRHNATTYHSAMNPLDYCHEQEDNNEYKNLSRIDQDDTEEEELKYEEDYPDSCEEDQEDRLSSDSFPEEAHNSNTDKRRSIIGSIQNESSREFRSLNGTNYSKREKDGNMTLELSPEAAADRLMNDISQEMHRGQEDSKIEGIIEGRNTDNSREIKVSDDMRRNLSDALDNEINENEEKEFSERRNDRMGSFGRPKYPQDEKTRDTPKMGRNEENDNPYNERTYEEEEIGLNLEKFDLKNKNFSDLVINGRVNREVLIDKIKRNELLHDEYTRNMNSQMVNQSSHSQLLPNCSDVDSKYEDPNAFSLKNRIEPNIMRSKQLANQFIFGSKDGSSSKRNDRVNNSCIVVSKSHADLGLISNEKSSSKSDLNVINFQTFFEIFIETLSSLEADIARNFNVVSNKLKAFHNEFDKIYFEINTLNHHKSSNETNFESIEKRLNLFSERNDSTHQMVDNVN